LDPRKLASSSYPGFLSLISIKFLYNISLEFLQPHLHLASKGTDNGLPAKVQRVLKLLFKDDDLIVLYIAICISLYRN
jgi:hypothetical protein